MPKHVKEIFKRLNELRKDEQKLNEDAGSKSIPFLLFMDYLCDQIKNLAARLCILDKKSNKALLSKIQTELEITYSDNLYLTLIYLNLRLCNSCFLNP